ncbi:MAG: hypothetical protein BWY93_02235 [Euryarchaeota archaeon ADurb.BinA087]|nr:MAG: hypothetical protein BWY93_02235 [Euryarchaeota archaeon ADurb.BinA087]
MLETEQEQGGAFGPVISSIFEIRWPHAHEQRLQDFDKGYDFTPVGRRPPFVFLTKQSPMTIPGNGRSWKEKKSVLKSRLGDPKLSLKISCLKKTT